MIFLGWLPRLVLAVSMLTSLALAGSARQVTKNTLAGSRILTPTP
jgi:hypothetical protein